MKLLINFTFCILMSFLLVGHAEAANLKGKVSVAEDTVSGVEVAAYPVDTLGFNQKAPYRFSETKADGHFILDLPHGEYYLLARGKGLFSYYGRNPVSVPREGLENVNLLMVPEKLVMPKTPFLISMGVSGQITANNIPVPNAIVTVYPDLSSQLKGLGLGMAAPTDEKGFFEIQLPAGTYYLVVRVRKSGMMAGPLQAGDLFGFLPENPVVIKDGSVARVQIPVIEVPEKVNRHAANLFGNTRITGVLLDANGSPVEGVRAMLYDDPMMLNRPLYVSQPSDVEGSFVLSFPKGGKYYLSARNELGGTPAPGELYGRYQGSPDHSVRIDTGKILEGLEIRVDEVY